MTCFNCCGYFCVTLKVIAGIATLVALGIPYWYKGDTTETTGLTGTVKTTIREGLWKTCTDLDSSSDSSSFCVSNEATAAIKACRALMFVSAGLLGIAVLAAGAAIMEKNRKAFITAGVFGLLSILTSASCLAVYGIKVKDDLNFELKHLYAAYWLAIVAMVITLLSSLLAFILARMVGGAKKEEESTQ